MVKQAKQESLDDSPNDVEVKPSEKAIEPNEEFSDVLPDDLQPDLVDPEDYIFPDNNRRRTPAYLYFGVAALLLVVVFFFQSSVYSNGGLLGAAVVLIMFGGYSLASGWDLKVDERDALVIAINKVGFAVGHASAQMGWRGLLSKPTWRILLYSADEPPTKRGFVMVDGFDGSVVENIVEKNPEDWREVYDANLAASQAGSKSS